MIQQKCALQLYTLREECKVDFPKVLREIKSMGWAGVQFAGYHGYDPEVLAETAEKTGLQTAGLHVSYQRVTEELDELIAEARMFKTRDLIMSSTPMNLRDLEGYTEIKKRLNAAAEQLRLEDMRISYHNHAYEFDTAINGLSAFEFLLEPTMDNLILAEIDVYWVKKGGYDPLSIISRYSGRMPIIHLKDMALNNEQTFAEIGEGCIDFSPILKWGEQNGIEWYVVEQDKCFRAPMDCVQTSFTNLSRIVTELK
ncbi:sugar phosphate isomerase/epimerase [Paenibacillus oryzisoli]|uniref:sugar phosphate isomerase/epimerase family protein n=1 Tax=Paenibacillus oryzisoli TaxID=1850517 RepID=UPI003D2DFE05